MAKAPVDVYKDWLGIKDVERPLSYYRLLRVKLFEDDTAMIREQYRKMNAHVRKYASGEYAEESQALLNELAKAMLCLTDSGRKLEYDLSLGRKVATSKARRPLDEVLIANGLVPEDRMKQVKKYADVVGIDLQEAVLQQKLGTPEAVMLAYAESIGSPFVSIDEIGVDENIAVQVNPNLARLHSFVPLMIDRGTLLLASPKPVSPDVEEDLRIIFGVPVRSTICTPSDINAAIAKYYPRDAVQLVRRKDGTAAVVNPSSQQDGSEDEYAEEQSVVRDKVTTPKRELTEEEKKDRIMKTVVGFNFGAMGVFFGLNYIHFMRGYWYQMPVCGFIGFVIGATIAMFVWHQCSKVKD